MARQNRNGQLEAAVATLINNQAMFLAAQARTDERFARIEDELSQIRAILLRHERALNELPEAIRQKVGFKNK
ncbi:MAG TPA: hypothetical protein VGL91_04075 [Acidobacteriota bacterium]|jgi:hypothetical protein